MSAPISEPTESFHMDFARRVVIHTDTMDWRPSPAAGVWRKPLAREFAEHGHATSVVRYEPGSRFPAHTHPRGEEILVLEGVFSDEQGDFGPGCYFRNPPGSRHAPFSEAGCTLLVKLHQFAAGDDAHVCVDTATEAWLPGPTGLEILHLHRFGDEHVSLVRWPAGERCRRDHARGGEELFVIAGALADADGRYPAGTWVRSPDSCVDGAQALEDSLIWLKVGHFPDPA